MIQVEKSVNVMHDTKMERAEAHEAFNKIEVNVRSQGIKTDLARDSTIAIENYIEKYVPMNVLKIIDRIFKPIFVEPSQNSMFKKIMANMLNDCQ